MRNSCEWARLFFRHGFSFHFLPKKFINRTLCSLNAWFHLTLRTRYHRLFINNMEHVSLDVWIFVWGSLSLLFSLSLSVSLSQWMFVHTCVYAIVESFASRPAVFIVAWDCVLWFGVERRRFRFQIVYNVRAHKNPSTLFFLSPANVWMLRTKE